MLVVYSYHCECSWSKEYVTGGFRRPVPLVERVETQLLEARDKKTKAVWRSMYQQIIKEEIVSEEIRVQTGFISCLRCKSSKDQMVLRNAKNGVLLHPILCHQCGSEGHFCVPPETSTCPNSQRTVASGKGISTQDQLKQMLEYCEITLSDQFSDPFVILIGDRAIQYSVPHLKGIPHLKIQEGKSSSIHVMESFDKVSRVYIHTYFDNPFISKLVLLMMKQFFTMNIEVVPIIATPATFEGRRRAETVMNSVKDLQLYSARTILLSGGIQKKFDTIMALYEEYIPSQLKEIIEKESLKGGDSIEQV
ncbi:hypothetical protein [Litchfieldia alkalitelluris]|uniref:hypothetical protein n=1 Tax=Litchfieldia alkalitelluris TaxID=304268 RepID=UPI000995EE0B|nr:hypothetical protein [Litchfieldia alkalitelluris]